MEIYNEIKKEAFELANSRNFKVWEQILQLENCCDRSKAELKYMQFKRILENYSLNDLEIISRDVLDDTVKVKMFAALRLEIPSVYKTFNYATECLLKRREIKIVRSRTKFCRNCFLCSLNNQIFWRFFDV